MKATHVHRIPTPTALPPADFPELLFHYKGIFTDTQTNNNSFASGIHGQANQWSRFSITEPFGIFGVQLYPQALGTIFGIAPRHFANGQISLSDCLNATHKAMHKKMMNANSHEE